MSLTAQSNFDLHALMNKDEYYEISRKNKAPKRCPILDYCSRRAWTLYFFGGYGSPDSDEDAFARLEREGHAPSDLRQRQIPLRGEPPSFQKSDDYVAFWNMCPEVSLFDADFRFGFAARSPLTSATWNDKQGITHSEHRHFTECPEFCAWSAQNSKAKRQFQGETLPPKQRAAIIARDHGRCLFTGQTSDQIELQVHHIISRRIIELLRLTDDLFTAPYNLVTVSAPLNIAKSAQLTSEDIDFYIERFSDPTHPNYRVLYYLDLFRRAQGGGTEEV